MAEAPDQPDSLRAVERGLAVLAALADPRAPLTVSEIAEKVGFSRASVRRIILTLHGLGYVAEPEAGRFAPDANVLRLGWYSLALRSFAELAHPMMAELAERTGQIAVLSRRFRAEIVVDAVVAPEVANIFHVAVGDRLAPLTSDAGRLLLTSRELDDPLLGSLLQDSGPHVQRFIDGLAAAESSGYCLVDQEMEPGLLSIGVRVRGRDRAVVAALSLFAYAGNTTPEDLMAALPLLRSSSERLERALLRGAAAFAV